MFWMFMLNLFAVLTIFGTFIFMLLITQKGVVRTKAQISSEVWVFLFGAFTGSDLGRTELLFVCFCTGDFFRRKIFFP